MQLEKLKINEIKNDNEKINKVWGKVTAYDTLTGLWGKGFLTMLFSGLTFGISALLLSIDDSIFSIDSIGTLILLYTITTIYFLNINEIFSNRYNKNKVNKEFEKLFLYMDLIGENETGEIITTINNIVVNELDYSYEENKAVLKGLNLNFNELDWIGIKGESGAGKTTLLDCILKLYSVNDNSIKINNKNINELNTSSIRKNITKISQEVFLLPGTIFYNFKLLNSQITEEEVYKFLEIACIDNYIKSLPLGLNSQVGELGKLLSVGEKQRLSIALGLSRKTKWYLFDESTSNLDKDIEKKLLNNLKEYKDENKLTFIMISHGSEFLNYTNKVYKF